MNILNQLNKICLIRCLKYYIPQQKTQKGKTKTKWNTIFKSKKRWLSKLIDSPDIRERTKCVRRPTEGMSPKNKNVSSNAKDLACRSLIIFAVSDAVPLPPPPYLPLWHISCIFQIILSMLCSQSGCHLSRRREVLYLEISQLRKILNGW